MRRRSARIRRPPFTYVRTYVRTYVARHAVDQPGGAPSRFAATCHTYVRTPSTCVRTCVRTYVRTLPRSFPTHVRTYVCASSSRVSVMARSPLSPSRPSSTHLFSLPSLFRQVGLKDLLFRAVSSGFAFPKYVRTYVRVRLRTYVRTYVRIPSSAFWPFGSVWRGLHTCDGRASRVEAHLVSTIMATMADLAGAIMETTATMDPRNTNGDAVQHLWRCVQNLLLHGSQDRKTIQKLKDDYHELEEIQKTTMNKLEDICRRHNSDQELIRCLQDKLRCRQVKTKEDAELLGDIKDLANTKALAFEFVGEAGARPGGYQPGEAGPPNVAPSAEAQGDKNFHLKVHYVKKPVIMDDKRGVVFEATENAKEVRNRKRREQYAMDKAKRLADATGRFRDGVSTTAAVTGSSAASSSSEAEVYSPAAASGTSAPSTPSVRVSRVCPRCKEQRHCDGRGEGEPPSKKSKKRKEAGPIEDGIKE